MPHESQTVEQPVDFPPVGAVVRLRFTRWYEDFPEQPVENVVDVTGRVTLSPYRRQAYFAVAPLPGESFDLPHPSTVSPRYVTNSGRVMVHHSFFQPILDARFDPWNQTVSQ